MVALDPQTHEMTFANAGHGPALHFERASGRFHPLESTGLPIGFDSDDTISAGRTIRLAPGDVVLLATDGVTDNMLVEELSDIVRAAPSPSDAAEKTNGVVEGRLGQGGVPEQLGRRFRHDDRTAIFRFFPPAA